MTLLYKLTQYKAVLMIGVIMMTGLLLVPAMVKTAPPSSIGQTGDVFGTEYIIGTEAGDNGLKLGSQDLRVTAANIINVALGLLGIVAVVIILIGGFRWMTAGGNDEKVGEARKWIFSGIIGLAIILSAWAIAQFVLEQLGQATEVQGYI